MVKNKSVTYDNGVTITSKKDYVLVKIPADTIRKNNKIPDCIPVLIRDFELKGRPYIKNFFHDKDGIYQVFDNSQ